MGSMPFPIDLSSVLLGCTFSGVAPGYLLNPFGLFFLDLNPRLRNVQKHVYAI